MHEKAKFSFFDKKGKLFVDCAECERGGNGSDPDKCSAGWRVKKGNNGGCFIGTLKKELFVNGVKPVLSSEFLMEKT